MKNILLLAFGNIHNETLLWALINDYNVDPSCLCVVFYDGPEENDVVFLPGGIEQIPWKDACELRGAHIGSLLLQSLHKANARALQDFVAVTGLDYDRVHILITDNEVDLWNSHVERFGCLDVGNTPGIDSTVREVLGKVDRYICMDRPYGDLISKIVGRPIITPDTFPLRRVLSDPVEYSAFAGPARIEVEALQRRAGNRNILIQTKPLPYRRWRIYMRDLLRFALAGHCKGTVNIWLWERRKRWSLLEMIEHAALVAVIPSMSRVLRHIGRPDIRIRTLPSLTRQEYLLLLWRCHAVIGQHRSGGGALTEALRWNRLVMLPKGLYNDVTLQEVMGLPILHRKANSIAEIVEILEGSSRPEGESALFLAAFAETDRKFWRYFKTWKKQ